jgi:hypothetical protein
MESLQGDFCWARRSSIFRSRGIFSELRAVSQDHLTSRIRRAWKGRAEGTRDDRAEHREEIKTEEKAPRQRRGLFRSDTAICARRACDAQEKIAVSESSRGKASLHSATITGAHMPRIMCRGHGGASMTTTHNERTLRTILASNPVRSCLAASYSLGQGHSFDVAALGAFISSSIFIFI